MEAAESRKARGAFFTPPELSDFLAEWAIRSPLDTVFEPSCGEASFLLSAGRRLQNLGAPDLSSQLVGVDIHEDSVSEARRILTENGLQARIEFADFFDQGVPASFDAVIGNPPYVRYQAFTGEARAKAQRAALAQGVQLTGLSSSWAAFVVHASALLNPDGRLALVLPAELLTVNYAAPIRRFLLERFAKVALVLFETRVFPGVLEEVVLLLAEERGKTDRFDVYQARDLTELRQAVTRSWIPATADEKWIEALLPEPASKLYGSLTRGEGFTNLQTWGETSLGMVTGNNRFFALSVAQAKELKLSQRELLPISPPGSRHLRGLACGERAWKEMRLAGSRVYLFYPPTDTPSEAARAYIAHGEALGVHTAFKCRIRSPWWRVPLVAAPDLLLTYMNQDTPRLVTNRARVRYLNSVHGVRLRRDVRQLGSDLLPLASLNSVTLLASELVGRAYGGGILKLEPKEADRLPVPSPETIRAAGPALRALRASLAQHLRRGDLQAAAKLVDRVLLVGELGVKRAELSVLREARDSFYSRRAARSGKA